MPFGAPRRKPFSPPFPRPASLAASRSPHTPPATASNLGALQIGKPCSTTQKHCTAPAARPCLPRSSQRESPGPSHVHPPLEAHTQSRHAFQARPEQLPLELARVRRRCQRIQSQNIYSPWTLSPSGEFQPVGLRPGQIPRLGEIG